MGNGEHITTSKKAKLYEVMMPLLKAMFREFRDLSKKKPEGVISKKKIVIVNRLLIKCREVLHDEESIEYIDLLDEDDLPQNSDVVLMLSQYVAAMNQFQENYHESDGIEEEWSVNDE